MPKASELVAAEKKALLAKAEADAARGEATKIFGEMSPERDKRINERVRFERDAHELRQDAAKAAREALLEPWLNTAS